MRGRVEECPACGGAHDVTVPLWRRPLPGEAGEVEFQERPGPPLTWSIPPSKPKPPPKPKLEQPTNAPVRPCSRTPS
jgi:hypothetical protein